jgi:fucose permease
MNFHPTYLQAFCVVALPLMGVVYALLGGVKLSLAERLNLDEGKVGGLVSAFGMMVGPTILGSGFLTDSVGRKTVYLAGAVLVVLAIFILANTRSYKGALIAVLLLGAGWSATINVANVLERVSVGPSSVMAALNFYDFIFGLGAFVTPMILALLLRRLGHRAALSALAAVSIIPIAMGFGADMNPDHSGPVVAASLSEFVRTSKFWLVSLAFLFYVPLESGVAGWATTLVLKQTPPGEAEERGRKISGGALSGFWLGFSGSRLAVAVLAPTLVRVLGEEGKEQKILMALSIVCLVLMALLVTARSRGLTVATVVAAGLTFGPIFPTLMTVYLMGVPATAIGRAVGFFFFFASVGWTVIPMLIGAVAKRTNIQRGFVVAAASAAIFVGLVIVRGMTAH